MTPMHPGEVTATIRALFASLQPAEQAVATILLERSAEVVELSSQQVAEAAGASRATVVRTCQSLGFRGYQQLRVLLARDLGYQFANASIERPAGEPETAADVISEAFRHVASTVSGMTILLSSAAVNQAVEILAKANRVVVIANGLSAPLAANAAARLTTIGRSVDAPADAMYQQITARLLKPQDAVVVISSSGSNAASVSAAAAAQAAGARVIAVTSFDRTALTALADVQLVVTMPDLTFRDEIVVTSRVPQTILIEALVAAVMRRIGPSAIAAKALALDAVSDNLAE